MSNTNSEIVSAIKEWASPMLIAIVGTLLWSDLSELKSDVKMLLIQQRENATRIELLERDVQILKQRYATENNKTSYCPADMTADSAIAYSMMGIPVWMRIGPFKKEEEVSVESLNA